MAVMATRQESTLYSHTLPNGLQLLGQKIPGVQSVSVVFYVNTGTRDERVEEMGVSHFLEHMAFKRTANYNGEEIDRKFEEMGAEHNAGTWKEMTFYWARVLGEHAGEVIELLSELTHPVLNDEDFQRERSVILEEIAQYEDHPSHALFDRLFVDYFGTHPLSWETLGTAETINALTIDQMRAYWSKHYGASNILFAIAGNFAWDEVVSQVESLTAHWDKGQATRRANPAEFIPRFAVYPRNKFIQQQIAIAVPAVNNTDPRYYTSAVLSTILGDDTGSRLFWALYQEGLAESATAQVFDFDDNGMLFVHVATEPAQTQTALDVAERELRRFQEFDITEDELARAKAKLNSSVIIAGESTYQRVMGLINSWLTVGHLETLREVRDKIEAVGLDDLRAYLRDFPVWPHQVVISAGPLGEPDLRNPLG